ncbi:MAG: SVM family protein [Candidatus Phytoplasma australasiaticum]|nr:SVM family protein [Candidatus Phytoplasma australasiaticum]MDV3199773.1 SVM family protein [Candidatus Phytoplasma australasiaticum]
MKVKGDFKLQNKFKIINFLFTFLGLFIIIINNQDENYINAEINKLYLKQKN